MRRRIICALCTALLLTQAALPSALAEGLTSVLRLPAALNAVEEEAFMGDIAIRTLTIPAGTEVVGQRAFADCAGLAQVTIEDGASLVIQAGAFSGCAGLEQLLVGAGAQVSVEAGAFSGCSGDFDILVSGDGDIEFADGALANCGDVTIYAHQGSHVEQYALAHGYRTVSLDSESALEQARALVAAYGIAPTALQSGGLNFESHRLIVVTQDDRLPDISQYEPVYIARDGEDTYYIQFNDEVHTVDCFNALEGVVELVEPDLVQATHLNYYTEEEDVISAAAVTDNAKWGTDDPMGFDYYAQYVAENCDKDDRITIAVIDSGIAKGKGFAFEGMVKSGVNMAASASDDGWRNVSNYHGSIIASVIYSCVGNNNVDLMAIRVEEETGAIDSVLLEKAIRYAIDHGANIINLSLRLDGQSRYVTRAIQAAIDRGITVVVAAGNIHKSIDEVYPANVPGVKTVAGVAPGNRLSDASGYGAGVSYAAPSEYIKHLIYKSRTSTGTSFAAPQIAAALALVRLDPFHSVSDMNDTCLPIENGGLGMPLLNQLAVVPTIYVDFGDDTPGIMEVGKTHVLNWEVYPDGATDKMVSVTSSNAKVIRVDGDNESGFTLNALKKGSATITLEANDGNSDPVSRTIAVLQPVTAINLTGDTHSVWMGADPFQLTAEALPTDATDDSIAWSSEHPEVASVDDSGLVTPIAPGSTVIRAEAEDGFGAFAEWRLTVSEYPDAESLVISDGSSTVGATMCAGASLQLSAIIAPAEANQEVVWSVVQGTGKATVTQDGLVTATQGGTATVFAFAKSDMSLSGSFELTIKPAPTEINIQASTTVIWPDTSAEMTLTIAPENAYMPDVKWYSSDPSVIAVDINTGALTVVNRGSAEIYAVADTGVADGSPVMDGVTLYSNRVEINVLPEVTIHFEANGGSVSIASKEAFYNRQLGPLPNPTRPNYTFTGWYTEDGTRYYNTSICDKTWDFTLYAHWQLKIFTITFNANGGSVGTASKTATVNTAIGTLPTPSRDYYTFAGWYTDASGGTQVTSSTTYSSAQNVTLYAHWTENSFGSWSGWSDTAVSSSWYREVQTQSVPVYASRTIYHYHRYIWYSKYSVSYKADAFGTGGTYEEYSNQTQLASTGRSYLLDGVRHYEYTTVASNTLYKNLWYDEWTSSETYVSGYKTQYSYRDRIR